MLRNSVRRVGVEIEVIGYTENVLRALREVGIEASYMGYTHEVVDVWKIVTDSSITFPGIELVSPPLTRSSMHTQLRKVSAALQAANCAVDKSCGFHVHHQVSDLLGQDLWRLYRLYFHFEDVLDRLMARSRTNNTYCRKLWIPASPWHPALRRDSSWTSFIGWMCACQNGWVLGRSESIGGVAGGGSSNRLQRYAKLNFQSLDTYGTAEFRQHQGTLNARKMAMWVDLTQRLVERCKHPLNWQMRHLVGRSTDLDRLLRELGIEEWMPQWGYWQERYDRFNQ